jgi:hypothetical protein
LARYAGWGDYYFCRAPKSLAQLLAWAIIRVNAEEIKLGAPMKKLSLAAFAFMLLATHSPAANTCRFGIILESLNNPLFVLAEDGRAAKAKGLGFVECIDFNLEQVITPSTTGAGG